MTIKKERDTMPYKNIETKRAKQAAYRESHRALLRYKSRLYERAHREEINKRKRSWRHNNPSRSKLYARAYYIANRERVLSRVKAYNKAHKPDIDKLRQKWSSYRAAHREQLKANNAQYRERCKSFKRFLNVIHTIDTIIQNYDNHIGENENQRKDIHGNVI